MTAGWIGQKALQRCAQSTIKEIFSKNIEDENLTEEKSENVNKSSGEELHKSWYECKTLMTMFQEVKLIL